ncbi:MAG: four helix bundle protein [Verrucomicrobia bacterium]|nr:four helix bundle protein [Verrucomicrobiota bacterium]
MNADELSKRLWHFAARVAKTVDKLPDTRVGRHVAGQLVRCGTSAPPNYDEGCAAESRADFIHKLSVALKELRETRGWLYFVTLYGLLPAGRVAPDLDECDQLKRIIGQSVATASGGSDRKRSQRPPADSIRNSQ